MSSCTCSARTARCSTPSQRWRSRSRACAALEPSRSPAARRSTTPSSPCSAAGILSGLVTDEASARHALESGMNGKVVLVTGAAGGIGGAVVRAFEEAGATVIGVDRERRRSHPRGGRRPDLRRAGPPRRRLQRRRDQRAQPRRRPHRRVHRGGLGRRPRRQPEERLPLLQARDPAPPRSRRRRDRQPLFRPRARRRRRGLRDARVCREQGRDHRPDAGDRRPLRAGGDPLQRDRARPDRDADERAGAGGRADPREADGAPAAHRRARPPRGRRRQRRSTSPRPSS